MNAICKEECLVFAMVYYNGGMVHLEEAPLFGLLQYIDVSDHYCGQDYGQEVNIDYNCG